MVNVEIPNQEVIPRIAFGHRLFETPLKLGVVITNQVFPMRAALSNSLFERKPHAGGNALAHIIANLWAQNLMVVLALLFSPLFPVRAVVLTVLGFANFATLLAAFAVNLARPFPVLLSPCVLSSAVPVGVVFPPPLSCCGTARLTV